MERMVDSVKIIHDELRGGEYRFLADFFRLVGSHVCDCTLKREFRQTDFDAVIVIKEGLEETNVKRLEENYPKAVFMGGLDLNISCDENKIKYLNDCLDGIYGYYKSSNATQANVEIDTLKKIAAVFVENHLLKARNSFAYFYSKADLVQAAQDQYVEALLTLSKDEKLNKKTSKYYIYATVNIARFINETCSFLKQELLFDTQKCMDEIDGALKLDPAFANIYALKGFLAEIDPQFRKGCGSYYMKAVEELGDQPYTSYLYYRLARYYEKVESDWNTAGKYYKKSLEVNSEEYRTVYKIMLMEKKERKYIEAIESCKKICNILDTKLQHNYLQKKEYEYLMKSYHSEGILYGKYLNNETGASKAFEDRNQLCEKIGREENGIYIQIYGEDDAEKFREMTYKEFKLIISGAKICG